MRLDVLLTPRDIPTDLSNNCVVVFDVLRATTTMAAALAAGVSEIQIFDSIDSARTAATAFGNNRILCGERNCLAPAGFDLGNSPGGFDPSVHHGRTVFMCTTNGTRAILAARSAKSILIGALVNASAIAARLMTTALEVALLCAGTDGQPAMEDLLGAGAVIDAITKQAQPEFLSDIPLMALELFRSSRPHLQSIMANTRGGKNIQAAGLTADIAFAARIDSIPVLGQVLDHPLKVVRA